ncbi:MAG: hypothetical protein IT462_04675 [Planctomycetes bacterium]|nr:hypothetical protein [Planctomycetota bacterium]
MKVFRLAATAWLAAAVLLCVSIRPWAQDAEVEEEKTPEPVSRTYDLYGMVVSEYADAPPNTGIGDVLSPERLLRTGGDLEHGLNEWTLRDSGREARCWDSPEALAQTILDLCSDGSDWWITCDDPDMTSFDLKANEEMHKRVAWVMGALTDVAKARVNLLVYEMPAGIDAPDGVLPPDAVDAATKNARLIGTLAGGLGDRMVLQRTGQRSYVADYDATVAEESAMLNPRTANLVTGNEFVFGAIVLPGGRLWLQGWHSALGLEEMRTLKTSGGDVELPRSSYNYSPVSTVIENGGAAVVDAGRQGSFLVIGSADRDIPSRSYKQGATEISLHNLTGLMHGTALGGSWVMAPNHQQLLDDGLIVDQIWVNPPVDGPYRDASLYMIEHANNLNLGYTRLVGVGPYLAVRRDTPSNEDEAAAFADEGKRLKTFLARGAAETPTVSLRVMAWNVGKDAVLPKTLGRGRVTQAELAELDNLGERAIDRSMNSRITQRSGILDLRLAAHVSGYFASVAKGAAAQDPQISTLMLGSQVQWVARPAAGDRLVFEVRAGMTQGPAEFEAIAMADGKLKIERSRSDLIQAELNGDLGPGEYLSAVCESASGNGERMVLVVQRVK